MATVIAAIIVFGIVGLDVFYLVRQRMQGKSSCSCGDTCGGCAGCKGGSCCGHACSTR